MTIVDRLSGIRGALAYKAPVKAATTANITLTGEQTIDGVAVVDGDFVLVKDQATGSENGIYVASTGDWVRRKDFNGTGDITQGTQILVAQGTVNGATPFRLTTANPITIDTTNLAFAELVLGASGTGIFDTVADVQAASIAATDDNLSTAGFTTVGDGGGALYKRAVSEPSHGGKIQSADGAWWELASTNINIRMFGASPSAIATANTAAIRLAIAFVEDSIRELHTLDGNYLITEAVATEVFLLTKPIKFIGAGLSRTFFTCDSSTPTTIDLFRLAPENVAGSEFDYGFEGISLTCLAGGSSPLNIDLGVNVQLTKLVIRNSRFQTASGTGWCIEMTKNISSDIDGFATSVIEDNIFVASVSGLGGISLTNSGDSLFVARNTITGTGMGIFVDAIDSAGDIEIRHNNITNDGGSIHLKDCSQSLVNSNQLEQLNASTNADNAILILEDSFANEISGNAFNTASLVDDCIHLKGAATQFNVIGWNKAFVEDVAAKFHVSLSADCGARNKIHREGSWRKGATEQNGPLIEDLSTGPQFVDDTVTAAAAFAVDNVLVKSDGTQFGTQATGIAVDDSDNVSGIGTLATTGKQSANVDDAVNSGVTRVHRANHSTSGTPANGIGVGYEYLVETSAAHSELGAATDAVVTDGTLGSEDFDYVISLMSAGAAVAEKFRVTSAGQLTGFSSIDLPADSIDDITEIAAALKSGADATLVTGTAGTSGDLAQWNVDGDLVDGPTPPTGTIVGTIGTPVDNEIGVWTGDGTIEGDSAFTWDGAKFGITRTETGDINDRVIGLDLTYNVASSGTKYGINTSLDITHATFTGTVRANFNQLTHSSVSTVALAVIQQSVLVNDSTGTITAARAGQYAIQNNSTGTITTAESILTNLNANGGTITTYYGLRLLNTALASTTWGIWQDHASVDNYFAGKIGIGQSTIAAKLHVDQESTTAAVPVLYLDQADVSEEMIEFNTTIGTGNAIEAVGGKTLTTTHFIKVTLPGGLTRYIPCGTIA